MSLIGYLFGGALGWLAGGLANWAADVLPYWNDEDAGRRRAPNLRHDWTLWWYPFRAGVCPHCTQKRALRAPLLEAGTIVVFVLAWRVFHSNPLTLTIAWLYAIFLLTVLVIDFEHRRVLNVMTGPAAVVVLAISFLPGGPDPNSALLGGAVGFGIFLVIAIVTKMGAGDVKLAGVIGLMTGYPGVLAALLTGIVLAGVAALVLLVSRRAGRKSYMAYAPYLSIGALIVLVGVLGA